MINISAITAEASMENRNKTEKEVLTLLKKLNIDYELVDNDVVETMAECEEVDKALGVEIRKSIFLCNKKKTSFFLVVLPAKKSLDTSLLCQKIGIPNLSFASEQYMEEYLGAKPGSACVMGLVNDLDDYVQLIMDKEVADAEWFGCNTGINTSHLKMKTSDLLTKFLPKIRHKAKIIEL